MPDEFDASYRVPLDKNQLTADLVYPYPEVMDRRAMRFMKKIEKQER
jgi:hypothetical protein